MTLLWYSYFVLDMWARDTDDRTPKGKVITDLVKKKYCSRDNYNPYTNDNDIAVLKLNEPLVFNKRVQPVTLADEDTKFDAGVTMMTMGFGMTPAGRISSTLLKVNLNYFDQETCKAIIKKAIPCAVITDRMMCAGIQ
ncbi:unnamed protein product [Leptidea sinapis]|uniref:Peptidase S1 domain-containing protein n=1 Tax=Leptidea sinapis TaxID=189913 RepID=A0A5E4PZA3_9NEOP|nr:unnamed protein product [Leptidea sinapis]